MKLGKLALVWIGLEVFGALFIMGKLQNATSVNAETLRLPNDLKLEIGEAVAALGVNSAGQLIGVPSPKAKAKALALSTKLEQAGYPALANELRSLAT